MRILVTGSEGMLGLDLLKILQPEHQIIALTYEKADIAQKKSLNDFLKNFLAPEFIIHAAAYTDVDGAESNFGIALAVNQTGTENLVELASRLNIPMLYVSTDYVFNGKIDRPYLEDDPPAPVNKYGLSKLKGEEAVAKLNQFFIARTSWLYGKNGKNFVRTMLGLVKKNRIIKVVNDQKGAPTYTRDLAGAIGLLIKTKLYGLYHLTNSGQTTWYDLAKKIFEISGDKVLLEPVSSQEFPRPAARPPSSVLSHRRWLKNGFPEIRPWEVALKDFILNDLGCLK